MKRRTTFIAMLSAIVGFFFSLQFQSMFHWGGKSFVWFYAGAGLSYIFAVTSIILMVRSFKTNGAKEIDIIFHLISSLLVGATLLWTTFIIIAWQSGF
jgi:hypothetical protein